MISVSRYAKRNYYVAIFGMIASLFTSTVIIAMLYKIRRSV